MNPLYNWSQLADAVLQRAKRDIKLGYKNTFEYNENYAKDAENFLNSKYGNNIKELASYCKTYENSETYKVHFK